MTPLSPRLARIVDALPLREGMRVLEIGGGSGAAAREVVARLGPSGHVTLVDRSATAIESARRGSAQEIAAGRMSVIRSAVEDFVLAADAAPYDLVFACRVGVLDGRHPGSYDASLDRLRAITAAGASLYVDTGDPLTRIPLHE
jgi:cyclopropane fatty-acyl-phospholipid synthase-like methyltransferase